MAGELECNIVRFLSSFAQDVIVSKTVSNCDTPALNEDRHRKPERLWKMGQNAPESREINRDSDPRLSFKVIERMKPAKSETATVSENVSKRRSRLDKFGTTEL